MFSSGKKTKEATRPLWLTWFDTRDIPWSYSSPTWSTPDTCSNAHNLPRRVLHLHLDIRHTARLALLMAGGLSEVGWRPRRCLVWHDLRGLRRCRVPYHLPWMWDPRLDDGGVRNPLVLERFERQQQQQQTRLLLPWPAAPIVSSPSS